MNDIHLVVIGIAIIVISAVSIYYYFDYSKEQLEPLQEEEEATPIVEEKEPIGDGTTFTPSFKNKDPTFKLGRGNVRTRGSNILYNIKSGDGTPAEPIPPRVCSLGYHKKPHFQKSYSKAGFTEKYNTDYISRNTIPACILNNNVKH